jgi:uncharacterized protein YcbK (DUF882 family)
MSDHGLAIFCHALPVNSRSSAGPTSRQQLVNRSRQHSLSFAAAFCARSTGRLGHFIVRISPVALRAARCNLLSSALTRIGATAAIAGVLVFAASATLQSAVAEGDTRTLTFHHVHTGEDITITYKRDGRYDEAALKRLDWFMRDWRKEQATNMDPRLFDALWEVYREVGARTPIEVICGYRSPTTNAMLRGRSAASGVAELSEHTLGHAIDFYIPGVPLEKLREVGLHLQRGGVGFYPTSGSPFVHMDVGNVRHWPRMTYAQLSKVFPDGRTVHVASDGRPLPGFALALADVERRGQAPNKLSLEQALAHGAISASQEQTAEAVALRQKRMLVAKIYGKPGPEEIADAADEATPVPSTRRDRVMVASAGPTPVATQRIVPMPRMRPQAAIALAAAATTIAKPEITASIKSFDDRGVGPAAPKPNLSPLQVADAGPGALAYAAAPERAPQRRTRAMDLSVIRTVAHEVAPSRNTTVAAKAEPFARIASGAQRLDSPWLRAVVLTPSVSGAMTATRLGDIDPRGYETLLRKPAQAVAMSFSGDPWSGMRTDRFGGSAVVFVGTATFVRTRTAWLD